MNRKYLTLFSSIFIFILCSCQNENNGLNQFIQYYDSYNSFIEKMEYYQNVHEEKEKNIFEIKCNYNCVSKYGIKGVCYCPLDGDRNTSHKKGDECPYFYYREPFYKLNNGDAYYDDCYVYYLDKVDFDVNSLFWDALIQGTDTNGKELRPSEYYLKDKNGNSITEVKCFEHFEKKEQILDDIINMFRE